MTDSSRKIPWLRHEPREITNKGSLLSKFLAEVGHIYLLDYTWDPGEYCIERGLEDILEGGRHFRPDLVRVGHHSGLHSVPNRVVE